MLKALCRHPDIAHGSSRNQSSHVLTMTIPPTIVGSNQYKTHSVACLSVILDAKPQQEHYLEFSLTVGS